MVLNKKNHRARTDFVRRLESHHREQEVFSKEQLFYGCRQITKYAAISKMIQSQGFSCLLRKLQYSDGPTEAVAALKEVANAVQVGDKSDLQEVLALLNSTPDHELKVKLLSILSTYLISSHNTFSDVIVTYRPLYDTIQYLLSRCLPIKTKTALNFILALLTTSNIETNNLKVFCRNMLRVSGCLMAMCDIFTSGMMYQDTWIALCQSIAESCSGCEVNQSLCSHLISVCVERCRLGNTDVCIVLQCLVYNHQRNLQLFFESGGQYIFTRQLLQHDTCMQMLSNIVQISDNAVQFLYSSGLVHHLRDFLHLYGPYSQAGQWSTIILYHLDNRIKGSLNIQDNTVKNMASEIHGADALAYSNFGLRPPISKQITYRNVNEKEFANRDTHHVTEDATTGSTMEHKEKNSVVKNIEKIYTTNDINRVPIDDDTINLFQNVIKEVTSWKSKSEYSPKTPLTPIIKTYKCHPNVTRHSKDDRAHKFLYTELNALPKNNLSFADFFREFDVKNEVSLSIPTNKYFNETGPMSNACLNFIEDSNKFGTTGFNMTVRQTASVFQYSKEKHSESDLSDFKPTLVSTPKRKYLNENSSIQTKLQNITKISYSGQAKRFCKSRINKQYKTNKSKTTQTTLDRTKDVKQRSMSARLFSAINDSCTTLVKSVKNIFTLKKDYNKKNKNSNGGYSSKNYEADSCNYSFTNYMRERDAILGNEDTQTEKMEYDNSNSFYRDSCTTCKDTIVLQHKMGTDKHLQQTIKRLKIGVHLYGCNFKKISKTLWPRNRYMTPNMLYNLYRKLIINGDHPKQEFSEKR